MLIAALLVIACSMALFNAINAQPNMHISCSMFHNASVDEWWPENAWRFGNISREEFANFPFPDGVVQLDAALHRVGSNEAHVGDVLVFRTYSNPSTIAHRVIAKRQVNWTHNWTDIIAGVPYDRQENKSRLVFETVGDNADFQMPYEREIDETQVIGKVVQANRTAKWARWLYHVDC